MESKHEQKQETLEHVRVILEALRAKGFLAFQFVEPTDCPPTPRCTTQAKKTAKPTQP